MDAKEYAERDPEALEPHFSRHMMAMTAEGLHSKGEIAAELAWRDARIEELEAVVLTVDEMKLLRSALLTGYYTNERARAVRAIERVIGVQERAAAALGAAK